MQVEDFKKEILESIKTLFAKEKKEAEAKNVEFTFDESAIEAKIAEAINGKLGEMQTQIDTLNATIGTKESDLLEVQASKQKLEEAKKDLESKLIEAKKTVVVPQQFAAQKSLLDEVVPNAGNAFELKVAKLFVKHKIA